MAQILVEITRLPVDAKAGEQRQRFRLQGTIDRRLEQAGSSLPRDSERDQHVVNHRQLKKKLRDLERAANAQSGYLAGRLAGIHGIFNGLAIVGIAIMFDRVSQAYGKRLQKHREIVHG